MIITIKSVTTIKPHNCSSCGKNVPAQSIMYIIHSRKGKYVHDHRICMECHNVLVNMQTVLSMVMSGKHCPYVSKLPRKWRKTLLNTDA